MTAHQPTGLGVHPGTASRCKDARWPIKKALDDAPFPVPERGFAMSGKDFGNRASGSAFDLDVGIDEGQAADLGETPSDSGFASPHHPDEDNRARRYAIG
ncbi:hypothetical protein GCM10007866_08060 [Gluconobacter albidus]|uniref:Uncharacterized protein n=1 Tax=Gluconobacter albidus TaxID=318683 RepID=A0ABQ5WYN2_9PROT|nr:hypothetical protein AA3250_2350 [Gluconobacter albidus NBRC 3250]GLQ68358.1 hypothetical protein GCM10007866_08060 [Gluconobacter albidus]